jgi:EpsI family protein
VLLLPGTIYVLAQPPKAVAESRLTELPRTLLGMPSVDVPASQMVLEDLRPTEILLRSYRRPDGEPLWLVVIFFQNARWGAHDPRLCYLSQGYRLEEAPQPVRIAVPGGPPLEAERFRVRKGEDRRSVLVWWYVPEMGATGDQETYRRLLMLQGLRERASYGAFVRVSTTLRGPEGEAEALAERFAAEVATWLPRLIRKGGSG